MKIFPILNYIDKHINNESKKFWMVLYFILTFIYFNAVIFFICMPFFAKSSSNYIYIILFGLFAFLTLDYFMYLSESLRKNKKFLESIKEGHRNYFFILIYISFGYLFLDCITILVFNIFFNNLLGWIIILNICFICIFAFIWLLYLCLTWYSKGTRKLCGSLLFKIILFIVGLMFFIYIVKPEKDNAIMLFVMACVLFVVIGLKTIYKILEIDSEKSWVDKILTGLFTVCLFAFVIFSLEILPLTTETKDRIATISGSIVGGALTLLGVLYTINKNKKQQEQEKRDKFKPYFVCKMSGEPRENLPVIDLSDIKSRHFIKEKDLNEKSVENNLIFRINYFSLLNTDESNFIIEDILIDGNSLDKSVTFSFIVPKNAEDFFYSSAYYISKEMPEVIFKIKDLLNEIYYYKLIFRDVVQNLKITKRKNSNGKKLIEGQIHNLKCMNIVEISKEETLKFENQNK